PIDRTRSTPTEKKAANGDDNVVPLPRAPRAPDLDDERRARKLEAEIEQAAHGDEALAAGLRSVNEADPTFTPKSFLEGAKQAYEMIVTGFAQGDRTTLKNLLEKDVFESFNRAISEREAAGQTNEFTFVGLPKVEISQAEYDKKNIY